jgi:hypothetical protein
MLTYARDKQGTLHILEIPRALRRPAPNEEAVVEGLLKREVHAYLIRYRIGACTPHTLPHAVLSSRGSSSARCMHTSYTTYAGACIPHTVRVLAYAKKHRWHGWATCDATYAGACIPHAVRVLTYAKKHRWRGWATCGRVWRSARKSWPSKRRRFPLTAHAFLIRYRMRACIHHTRFGRQTRAGTPSVYWLY